MQLNAAANTPAGCFASQTQKFTYEKLLSLPKQNETISECLRGFLKGQNPSYAKEVLPLLMKTNNLTPSLADITAIFRNTKDAQTAFAAAAALCSVPSEITPYEKQLFNVISSQNQADYKKTLAVIVLAANESVDSTYTSFLEPALNASDPVLKAYASAAYTMIMPETQTRFSSEIISLYGFDKNFALTALQATGLTDKQFYSALKEASKSNQEITRAGAIEWIGDKEDKKLLEGLFKLPYKDSTTVSAAANALASNYNLIAQELKRQLRTSPKSASAAIAVMTYAFLGSEHFDDIEQGLKSLNANEQANSARVVLAAAEILQGKTPYYINPQLEEQRIKKLILPLGKVASNAKDETTKYYADNALKALYDLINK